MSSTLHQRIIPTAPHKCTPLPASSLLHTCILADLPLAHLPLAPSTPARHNHTMDQAVVGHLIPTLQDALGAHLLAAYEVAPSGDGYVLHGRFEPALLLFVRDSFPVHEARDAVRRLRINWRQVLEAPPLVFTPTTLARYTRLFPLFNYHLSAHSRLLHGQIMPLESGARVHPVERLAFLISESIATSAALAPGRSSPDDLRGLQRLHDRSHLVGLGPGAERGDHLGSPVRGPPQRRKRGADRGSALIAVSLRRPARRRAARRPSAPVARACRRPRAGTAAP